MGKVTGTADSEKTGGKTNNGTAPDQQLSYPGLRQSANANYFKPVQASSPRTRTEIDARKQVPDGDKERTAQTDYLSVDVVRVRPVPPEVVQSAIDKIRNTQTGRLLVSGNKEQEAQKSGAPSSAGQSPPTPRKIVIRSGDIEFEIQSFDPAVAAISRLVNDIKGGFVDTVNSEKLPNGKVRGSVVVRVPPESLDTLLLDLRKDLGKMGELEEPARRQPGHYQAIHRPGKPLAGCPNHGGTVAADHQDRQG